MKSSYKLFTLFGIDVDMHISFIFFILFLFLLNATFAVLLSIVFVFVTLHEYSHSLVAKKLGIKVHRIVLLPIGGMAVMNIKRIKPAKEIIISLAGPMFNFLMCYFFIGIIYAFRLPFENAFDVIKQMHLTFPLIIYYSFYANFVLGVFNLFLPAFPLDGGRIFRGLLEFKFDIEKATLIAKNVSIAIVLLMLLYSLFRFDIWILLIAGFIYFGANAEYNSLVDSLYLSKVNVKSLLSHDFLVASEKERISEAIGKMQEYNRNYAVVEENLKLFDLSRIKNFNQTIGEASFKVPVLHLNNSLETALKKITYTGVPFLPVVDKGELVGVVKSSDILNFEKMAKLLKNKYVKRVLKL